MLLLKVKVKVHPITGHEGPEGEYRYSSTHSLPRRLDGGGWSAPRPGRFTTRKRRGKHCTGGWVGPRAGSGRVRKISPPPGFDPQNAQPVVQSLYRLSYRGPKCYG